MSDEDKGYRAETGSASGERANASDHGGHSAAAAEAEQGTATREFRVSGMDCADCARTVRAAASRVKGIEDCEVLLNAEKLRVRVSDDANAAGVERDLKRAIRGAGYRMLGSAREEAPT
ncbi:MAG: heavy-metal-associated domain-containing protein, partial [Spirochaetales bacterium]